MENQTYPIVHTLGSELQDTVISVAWGTTGTAGTFTINSGTSFDLAVTTTGTETARPFVSMSTLTKTIGETYKIYFNATVTLGTARITLLNDGGLTTLDHTITNGENVIEYTALDSTTVFVLYFDGTALFDISITGLSVKQITLPTASYLIYKDTATGKAKQISSTGDVGDELAQDFGFDDDTIIYSVTNASYSISNSKLLGVGTATIPANQVIKILDAVPIKNGKRYAFIDDISRATGSSVGYNTTNFEFDTGNAYYYHAPAETLGKHILYANAINTLGTVNLHVSTTVDAQTDWESFSLKHVFSVSTEYEIEDPHEWVYVANAPFSDADLAVINADDKAIEKVYLGLLILPSGFDSTNIVEAYNLNGLGVLRDLLPRYYNILAGMWYDLDRAFEITTKDWGLLTQLFRNGYIFRLADATQLKYLEEMLKVPVDETLSNEYRAGRLQAKLVPKVTTEQVIKNIAKQFYPLESPTLSGIDVDYRLTIYFGNMTVLPLDIDVFRNTIIDILQADLDFIVELDVAMSAFTYDELSAFTHDNLVAYRYST